MRKRIFARRILLSPTIRWIVDELQASSEHRLPEGHSLKAREDHFSPDQTERQLDIAIHWGRYAELFEFDDDRDELYLPKMEPIPQVERGMHSGPKQTSLRRESSRRSCVTSRILGI